MPQLDKYIFLSQILYLTLFFFLIYIYLRKTVIPDFSTIFKYRNRLIYINQVETVQYKKTQYINNGNFDKTLHDFTNNLIKSNNDIQVFFKQISVTQIGNLSSKIKELSSIENTSQFLRKVRLEKERLNSFL